MVVNPSRATAVLDTYFSELFEILIVVDRYTAFKVFPSRQMCWGYLIHEAKNRSIKKCANYLICHKQIQAMYYQSRIGNL